MSKEVQSTYQCRRHIHKTNCSTFIGTLSDRTVAHSSKSQRCVLLLLLSEPFYQMELLFLSVLPGRDKCFHQVFWRFELFFSADG